MIYNQKEYSLRGFDLLVKREAEKVSNEIIEQKANIRAENLLPERVAEEIRGYPNNCSETTKKLIEKTLDVKIGRRVGEYILLLFGGYNKRPRSSTKLITRNTDPWKVVESRRLEEQG